MKQAKGKEKEEDFDQSRKRGKGKEKEEEDFEQSRNRGKGKEKEEDDLGHNRKKGKGKEREEDVSDNDRKESKGKEKQEEDTARFEKHDLGDSPFDVQEFIRELNETREIGSARTESQQHNPGSEGQITTMSQDQRDLIQELCRERVPVASIKQMMGVHEGTVDSEEFVRVMTLAEISVQRSLRMEEEARGEDEWESDEEENGKEFEVYDPVIWETATGVDDDAEASVPGSSRNIKQRGSKKSEAPPGTPDPGLATPRAFEDLGEVFDDLLDPEPEAVGALETSEGDIQRSHTPEPGFVRALKDSKTGSTPYFRKGDILRVINQGQGDDLDDGYFQLLPLKPPGEAGEALKGDFEPASRAAVAAVGRLARTAKEKDSLQRAILWED